MNTDIASSGYCILCGRPIPAKYAATGNATCAPSCRRFVERFLKRAVELLEQEADRHCRKGEVHEVSGLLRESLTSAQRPQDCLTQEFIYSRGWFAEDTPTGTVFAKAFLPGFAQSIQTLDNNPAAAYGD